MYGRGCFGVSDPSFGLEVNQAKRHEKGRENSKDRVVVESMRNM